MIKIQVYHKLKQFGDSFIYITFCAMFLQIIYFLQLGLCH